jgi:hypothetical protein
VLAFFDGRRTAVGPTKAVSLLPGQLSFLDLNPSLLPGVAGPRIAQPRLLLPAAGGGDLSGCQGLGAGVRSAHRLDHGGYQREVNTPLNAILFT